MRVLSTKGNLRFKVDWARLIVGSKFTIFALFFFVFVSNFPSTSPRGAYISRGVTSLGGLYLEVLIFEVYEVMAKDQCNQHCIERSLTSPENTADEN